MLLKGHADASAIFTRRTEVVTSAPILRSFKRIVPQVARASSVPARPMRRSAQSNTYAMDANQRRS